MFNLPVKEVNNEKTLIFTGDFKDLKKHGLTFHYLYARNYKAYRTEEFPKDMLAFTIFVSGRDICISDTNRGNYKIYKLFNDFLESLIDEDWIPFTMYFKQDKVTGEISLSDHSEYFLNTAYIITINSQKLINTYLFLSKLMNIDVSSAVEKLKKLKIIRYK